MRILVVGGGAIGGITAAKLAADVVVLDANAEHAAAMREPGLVINDGPPVPLDAVESVDALDGAFDFALIAVKAPLHQVVLEPLVARGGIDTFVSMGNGLIQDRMEGIVGAGNLLACIVEWGGSNVGPGQLVRDSEGGYMLGELDGVARSRARRAGRRAGAGRPGADHGQRARHDLVEAADQQHLHRALGGVRAALRRRRRAGPRRRVRAVGRGRGGGRRPGACSSSACTWTRTASTTPRWPTTWPAPATSGRRCCRTSTRAGRPRSTSSTAASRRAGASSAIPTPCNDRVVELVHSMERGERSPDPRWLAYVSEAQTISATDS